ncbi:alpha-1,3/1,6-mannosyltransferase ALG2 [Diaphorina citri]|uniref:Alpha-1,3/1,6-mannosyltransferase ALG2 n=1 Tax=Diaphorina citri TaxID=121845 RepID=A0A1S3D6W9_DIACI|nr:alpha-1,3/1,6-mannosyltransferase ALG2 [Diaphorina citri]
MLHRLTLKPESGSGCWWRGVTVLNQPLKQKGFNVEFITSHHNADHCFKETKDGTLPVKVIGDWLPRNIFGKFYALCMYLRMIVIALYVAWYSEKPDLVFCDLVSICIPILQAKQFKVLFYCHYPDQLLSKQGSFLKSIYRFPLNKLEEWTTCKADKIVVNSEFTKSVVQATFRSLDHKCLDILYPSVYTEGLEKTTPEPIENVLNPLPGKEDIVFLSINRYERKKNLELAIYSLNSLRSRLSDEMKTHVKLVVAGGYDPHNIENVEYYKELGVLVKKLKLSDNVLFLTSPSDAAKISLFKFCHCIIYTPSNEHFGIVPIEAMFCKRPVIAVNSGGPKESVVDGRTGFLCESNEEAFAKAMKKIVDNDGNIIQQFSQFGFNRFNEKFSFQAFSIQLNTIVNNMLDKKTK